MITLLLISGLATVGSWSTLVIMSRRHRHARARWAVKLHAAFVREHTDALTGLRNRAGLMLELDRREHGGGTWSLALLDADHFKSINDAMGQGVGDEVLASIARRLRESAGDRAVVARLGGDEFAIVLADRPDEAMSLVQQTVEAVAAPHLVSGLYVRLSMSAGIAGFVSGMTMADLMRRADTALYRAKELESCPDKIAVIPSLMTALSCRDP